MKKFLFTFMFAMVAIAASADTFEQGDFKYQTLTDSTARLDGFKSGYTGSPTTLTIPGYTFNSSTQKYYRVTHILTSAFANKSNLANLTTLEIQYGVETILAYAFKGCTKLSSVYLPSSIKSIGDYVFNQDPITNINCAAETMPTISSYAFYQMGTVSGTRYWTCATPDGKTAADAVTLIVNNFTRQWSHTAADFHNHVMGSSSDGNLYDVYLNVVTPVKASNPYSYYGKVKLLGANARASTTNKTLKIGYNANYIQSYGHYYVTRIDKSMRYRCSDIQTLDMSETNKIDTIDDNAFNACTSLTKAIVSAKVIGANAFYNCTNLTTLRLYGSSESSQGVQKLGGTCFAKTGVQNVYIPSSLTSYGNGAFAFCGSLTQFTVSSSNSYFAADSNSPNCLYNKSKTILYQMGGGTKPSNMVDLSSSLPNTLTTINPYAMAGAKLSIVDIPYGVKTIGYSVFSGMPSVQTIRIPSSVTSIQTGTFNGLTTTTFKHLYINLKNVPSNLQYAGVFADLTSGVTLHVPLWRTNHYTTGSWWTPSNGWRTKFTAGVVEDAYDFSYLKVTSGNYIDYILNYTVSDASAYTDSYVQSAAVDGQLTVVGASIGAAGYFNGTVTFANTVSHRGKTYIITEVQREVFRNKTLIKKVTGGAGIKKIGPLSFAGLTDCNQGFNIPNPVEFCDSALFNCWTPTITLGNRLTTIGADAFRSTAVQQVIMPNSVTKIGARFLANSRQLDSLRLSPNITEIPTMGLSWVNCRYIIIPYGVKKINAQAFMSDQSTVSSNDVLYEPVNENVVVIPSSVTTIASSAFKYARHLDAIFLNVPYGVFTSSKNDWQRRNDYNADNVYNWDGHLLYVPYEYLSSYHSDAGIQAVFNEQVWVRSGAFDFYRGSDLWTTPYRMTVLNGTSKTAKYVVNGKAKVTAGSSIDFRTTESNAWNGQTYTMTEIGDGCMDATIYYSSNYEDHQGENFYNLTIPSTITRIGDYAFRGCSGLKYEVNVPEAVSYIGQYAFYGCTKLPSIFLNRTSTTTIGNLCWNSETNFATDKVTLYVPLNQYNNIVQQTKTWVPNMYYFRRVLPYVKPTAEWSTISVPVPEDQPILLPETGNFYYVPSYNSSTHVVNKTALENTKGIKGGEGMLFKGTVGTVYRFRQAPGGTNTPPYVAPSSNLLLGVPYDYNYVSYSYNANGPWYYMFDGTKFNKKTSSFTVPSGDACLRLQSSDGATSSLTSVYVNSGDITVYPVYINDTQVTSENASDLSVIDGVSGTVTYNATTKTLTLQNATIRYTGSADETMAISIYYSNGPTNIVLKGTNTVASTIKSAIWCGNNLTITGQGTNSLTTTANHSGCMGIYCAGILTFDNANVSVSGGAWGILHNRDKMIVKGAGSHISARGASTASISGEDDGKGLQLLDGLAITEPAGATANSKGTVVDTNGNIIKNQYVVISKPAGVIPGDVNGDGVVTSVDITILYNYLLNGDTEGMVNGDQDGDGIITSVDITMIYNILLGN